MSAISIRNVTYSYGRRSNRIRALDTITLDVHEGELVALVGSNGAGKTTLVKCLLGVISPEEGEIALLGGPVNDLANKRKIGCLPEAYPYDPFLSGRNFLEFHGGMAGLRGSELRARIRDGSREFDLTGELDRPIRHYSRGMCQRLGLLQALIHRPELVLLDEPTDGLDPVGRIALRDSLLRLRGIGTAILMNSHILSDIEMVCDRVAILHQGQVIRCDSVRELTATHGLAAIRISIDDRPGICGPPESVVPSEDGETCDILLHSPEEVHSMLDQLRRRGIRILEVRPKISSLEEVFLRSIGQPFGKEART
jgi:ABC-2 type transport system ATP-binding protein